MNKDAFAYISNGLCVVLTTLQENPVYQIVQLIITLIMAVLNFAYIIFKWYRKAKQDGKIDLNEVEELADTLHDLKEQKK